MARLWFVLFSILWVSHVHAAGFAYPALEVRPLASTRLEMETKTEENTRWLNHLPIQASAALTLAAAAIGSGSIRSEDNYAATVGLMVGGTWLTSTILMSVFYQPYHSAHSEVSKLKSSSKRDRLVKERLSEEAIRRAGQLGLKLMILSTVTNLAANAYLLTSVESGSMGFIAAAFGVVGAFAPVLFQYRWQNVASEQEEYKKRIYGPVVLLKGGILPEPVTRDLSPALLLSYEF